MKVRMVIAHGKSIAKGPGGFYLPGDTIDLDPAEAERLIQLCVVHPPGAPDMVRMYDWNPDSQPIRGMKGWLVPRGSLPGSYSGVYRPGMRAR